MTGTYYCAAYLPGPGRRCLNNPKDIRFGLGVCGTHSKQIDRFATEWGSDYALSYVRLYWERPFADYPMKGGRWRPVQVEADG